jgi:adenylate kinase
MGVIFVGGVYAVGKTTACTHVAKTMSMTHCTASGLIKAEKANAIPKQGKVVTDIEENQNLLIRGVQRVLVENNGRILLDGHFTLPNREGQIERIAIEVFKALDIQGVVVFHDEPDAIAARFVARDGESRSADVVAQHQGVELAHAQRVCDELGIPLMLLDAFDAVGLTQVVEQWGLA